MARVPIVAGQDLKEAVNEGAVFKVEEAFEDQMPNLGDQIPQTRLDLMLHLETNQAVGATALSVLQGTTMGPYLRKSIVIGKVDRPNRTQETTRHLERNLLSLRPQLDLHLPARHPPSHPLRASSVSRSRPHQNQHLQRRNPKFLRNSMHLRRRMFWQRIIPMTETLPDQRLRSLRRQGREWNLGTHRPKARRWHPEREKLRSSCDDLSPGLHWNLICLGPSRYFTESRVMNPSLGQVPMAKFSKASTYIQRVWLL